MIFFEASQPWHTSSKVVSTTRIRVWWSFWDVYHIKTKFWQIEMPNLCFLMVKTSVFCFVAVSKLDACVVAAKQRYNIRDWEKDVASKRKVTLSLPRCKFKIWLVQSCR